MGGRHLGADAGLALGHHGEEEPGHIDALVKKLCRHLLRQFCLAQHHRDDRVFARQQVESGCRHAGPEAPGVFEELGPQVIALLRQIDGLEAGRHDGRRQGVGKQIGPGALAHEIDDGFRRGDIASGRAAQCLAKCARQNIDLDARPLRRAAALGADETRGVAIVNQNQGVVSIGQLANVAQFGEITIHREHAVGNDDDAAGAGGLRGFQLGFKVIHAAIGKAEALGLGEPDAVDDRGMVQRIRDDGVLFAEQGFEHRAIGIETGGKQDRVIHAEVVRNAALECQMQIRCAADEAHRGHAEAVRVERLLGGGNEGGMIGQPQIIVGAEVQHLAAAGHLDMRRLVTENGALGLPQRLLADGVEFGGDIGQCGHGGAPRSVMALACSLGKA